MRALLGACPARTQFMQFKMMKEPVQAMTVLGVFVTKTVGRVFLRQVAETQRTPPAVRIDPSCRPVHQTVLKQQRLARCEVHLLRPFNFASLGHHRLLKRMANETFVAAWYANSCPVAWTDVIECYDDREIWNCPLDVVTTVRPLAGVRIVPSLSSAVHSGSPRRP